MSQRQVGYSVLYHSRHSDRQVIKSFWIACPSWRFAQVDCSNSMRPTAFPNPAAFP